MIPEAVKKQIIQIIGCTEIEYRNTMFQLGLIYARRIYGEEAGIKTRANSEFWEWWKNQFFMTDLQLLHHVRVNNIDLDDVRILWENMHSPEALKAFNGEDSFDLMNNTKVN